MSSKLNRSIIIGLLIVLIGIQFIRPSRKVPRFDPNGGFLALAAPLPEQASLIKNACYDCHSYETKYPWYANVAPLSWWMSNHVNEGRKHLNFSEWGKYPMKKRLDKLGEISEEVEEGHMPLSPYTWMHAGARLSEAQRQALTSYFDEIRSALGTITPMPQSPPTPPQ